MPSPSLCSRQRLYRFATALAALDDDASTGLSSSRARFSSSRACACFIRRNVRSRRFIAFTPLVPQTPTVSAAAVWWCSWMHQTFLSTVFIVITFIVMCFGEVFMVLKRRSLHCQAKPSCCGLRGLLLNVSLTAYSLRERPVGNRLKIDLNHLISRMFSR